MVTLQQSQTVHLCAADGCSASATDIVSTRGGGVLRTSKQRIARGHSIAALPDAKARGHRQQLLCLNFSLSKLGCLFLVSCSERVCAQSLRQACQEGEVFRGKKAREAGAGCGVVEIYFKFAWEWRCHRQLTPA